MVKYSKIEEVPFEESFTKKIRIKGIEFEVLSELPYKVGAKIADLWIKSMMGEGGFDNVDMTDVLNEILLSVVISPKLSLTFLNSPKCPTDFVGIAVAHFTKVIAGFGLLNNTDEFYEDESLALD